MSLFNCCFILLLTGINNFLMPRTLKDQLSHGIWNKLYHLRHWGPKARDAFASILATCLCEKLIMMANDDANEKLSWTFLRTWNVSLYHTKLDWQWKGSGPRDDRCPAIGSGATGITRVVVYGFHGRMIPRCGPEHFPTVHCHAAISDTLTLN